MTTQHIEVQPGSDEERRLIQDYLDTVQYAPMPQGLPEDGLPEDDEDEDIDDGEDVNDESLMLDQEEVKWIRSVIETKRVGGPMDTSPFSTSTTSNWVARVGGLPLYIRAIAHALMRGGHPESQAIEMAIGKVEDWARGGDHVHPDTVAKAQAALAELDKKRAEAHAMSAGKKAFNPDELRDANGKWVKGVVGDLKVGDHMRTQHTQGSDQRVTHQVVTSLSKPEPGHLSSSLNPDDYVAVGTRHSKTGYEQTQHLTRDHPVSIWKTTSQIERDRQNVAPNSPSHDEMQAARQAADERRRAARAAIKKKALGVADEAKVVLKRVKQPGVCKHPDCREKPTHGLLWAEGMAQVPVCDNHDSWAHDIIVNRNNDEVVGVRHYKQ